MSKFLSAEVIRRISEMDEVFVEHREFATAYSAIGRAIESFGSRKEPMGVQVRGPTGVGKSTLRDKLAQAFNTVEDGAEVLDGSMPSMVADYKPLLQLEMPQDPSDRSLITAMLLAYGDPSPKERDKNVLQSRLFKYIKACRTKGVVLDEAQRLIDGRGHVRAQDTLDFLKSMAAATQVALVLMGVGSLKHLLLSDAQFARRWANPILFEPYTWPEFDPVPVTDPRFAFTPDQEVLIGVFTAMETLIPMSVDPKVSILNPDPVIAYRNAKRYAYSSRCLAGFHKKLLLSAMDLSHGYEILTLELLAKAYDFSFLSEDGVINPFGPDWRGQPPPRIPDHEVSLRTKRKRPKTKKQKIRELGEALTK